MTNEKDMPAEDQPKWWLDSTAVRVALMAILPSVKTLLSAFHVEVGGDVVNAVVDMICFAFGIGSMVWQIWSRHQRKGGLSLTRPPETAA